MTLCIDGRLKRYLSTCVGLQQAFQEGENFEPPALQLGSTRHSASEHAGVSDLKRPKRPAALVLRALHSTLLPTW